MPEIKESIAVGQDWDNDVRVVLFVILQPGAKLDDAAYDKLTYTERKQYAERMSRGGK